MAETLVIVESPAKAKTIKKFLGRNYTLAASMGHIRDLPRSQFGVDVENGFKPKYITIRGKGAILKSLRQQAQKARRVLLATDPDREGEAIAWHLQEALQLDPNAASRIVFHEITKEAVQAAVKQPRPLHQPLIDAQQARRILDRLVGYQLSPLLWRKVRRGLSAGRVQSVAVRLICDREAEIQAFEPEEYWSLTAVLAPILHANGLADTPLSFSAKFYGDAEGKREIPDQQAMRELLQQLQGARFEVIDVSKGERKRNPAPPFTTSTLQQEASRKLNFNVRRTMRTAQQLYEGLEIKGEGTVGLITYMRTDSTRVAQQAIAEAKALIEERFGKAYAHPRAYGGRRASVQDAHEAIRPTSVRRHPDDIKADLTSDQYKLYRLIWERFVASQMSAAVMDQVRVEIAANDLRFRAHGSVVKFPGFRVLYVEGSDDDEEQDEDRTLPPLAVGQRLALKQLEPKQHFTQPPARYTEAMLVKTLEEYGIGRPSTYAPIISTIQERQYVKLEQRRFVPTEIGIAVTDLLKTYFPSIVDVQFTARMEAELDKIEEGERDWRDVLQEFYEPFKELLAAAEAEAGRVELTEETTDEKCEKCGRNMVIKHGRFGRFLACPGYPECKNTKPITEKAGVACPRCGRDVVVRRSRRGRVFYGCSGYPDCDFVTWHKPVAKSCPQCGAFLVQRQTKARGVYYQCSNDACDHTEAAAPSAPAQQTGQRTKKREPERSEAETELAELAQAVVRETVNR